MTIRGRRGDAGRVGATDLPTPRGGLPTTTPATSAGVFPTSAEACPTRREAVLGRARPTDQVRPGSTGDPTARDASTTHVREARTATVRDGGTTSPLHGGTRTGRDTATWSDLHAATTDILAARMSGPAAVTMIGPAAVTTIGRGSEAIVRSLAVAATDPPGASIARTTAPTAPRGGVTTIGRGAVVTAAASIVADGPRTDRATAGSRARGDRPATASRPEVMAVGRGVTMGATSSATVRGNAASPGRAMGRVATSRVALGRIAIGPRGGPHATIRPPVRSVTATDRPAKKPRRLRAPT